MELRDQIVTLLTKLVGEDPPIEPEHFDKCESLFNSGGVGYSQFNELLLLFGYDRINRPFFSYLADNNNKSNSNTPEVIKSIEELEKGITRFRVFAIFRFGNIKYAFKTLSKIGEGESFKNWLNTFNPKGVEHYKNRHSEILKIIEITGADTYYNGHLVKPSNDQERKRMEEVREIGTYNYKSYLASDHLDVYVATSMRNRHEYLLVNNLINDIFSRPEIKQLNLRWFNPTQAFCKDRIDKGLLEGLMLKRAKCTIYLAQETDTLGKDSELASTLAQGKPVIAYIPKGEVEEITLLLDTLKNIYKGQKTEFEILSEQLRIIRPDLPWTNKDWRNILDNPTDSNLNRIKEEFFREAKKYYDDRYAKLRNHPLGIQVNIETGVANGVLIVRSINDCAKLLKALLTDEVSFSLSETENGDGLHLIEEISNSIFRVVTTDKMLTNTFWNYYTKP